MARLVNIDVSAIAGYVAMHYPHVWDAYQESRGSWAQYVAANVSNVGIFDPATLELRLAAGCLGTRLDGITCPAGVYGCNTGEL